MSVGWFDLSQTANRSATFRGNHLILYLYNVSADYSMNRYYNPRQTETFLEISITNRVVRKVESDLKHAGTLLRAL